MYVLLNITIFYDFCCFRCVTHCMSSFMGLQSDVLYIYICCFITITKFLCWWSIINRLLSTAMKTLNLKYFGVTILIFRGHVTSSITWQSDSAWALSYWWSMMTSDHASILHRTLRRYKASKLHLPMLKAKSLLRMLRVTWRIGRGPKWPHNWNSRGHIAYSLYNFYGPTMTISGRL